MSIDRRNRAPLLSRIEKRTVYAYATAVGGVSIPSPDSRRVFGFLAPCRGILTHCRSRMDNADGGTVRLTVLKPDGRASSIEAPLERGSKTYPEIQLHLAPGDLLTADLDCREKWPSLAAVGALFVPEAAPEAVLMEVPDIEPNPGDDSSEEESLRNPRSKIDRG